MSVYICGPNPKKSVKKKKSAAEERNNTSDNSTAEADAHLAGSGLRDLSRSHGRRHGNDGGRHGNVGGRYGNVGGGTIV
ncbi:hypothetical protein HYQ46_012062 [Verticillium longisporum]|nr:hypothetical protein HYQ46_012062 [Verticillium longisporum]